MLVGWGSNPYVSELRDGRILLDLRFGGDGADLPRLPRGVGGRPADDPR